MIAKCGTCGLYAAEQFTCMIMTDVKQGKITPNDFCSQHMDKNSVHRCEICHNIILHPTVIELDPGEWHILCPTCAERGIR